MIGGRGDRGTRRFGTTYLDPISADDLHLALSVFTTDGWDILTPTGEHALVYMTPEAAGAIVALCHGEPFLFQLADARAWLAGTSRIIDLNDVRAGWELAKPEAEDHLQRILDRLPLRERQFVEAMALLPAADRTLTRIAEEMGLDKASSAGPTSQRLDRARGILQRGSRPYTFRHRALEAYLTSSWPDVDPANLVRG